MTEEQIKLLIQLSDRAVNSHVVNYGSAKIVIYAAELRALEEAIETLQKTNPKQ